MARHGSPFDIHVETRLAPALLPGTVFVGHSIHRSESFSSLLDNLPSHRSPKAVEILNARGCWMLFLPPCSPDLNPIEMAFPKLKAPLRRIAARTCDTLIRTLGDIRGLFDSEECRSFFKAVGYAPG